MLLDFYGLREQPFGVTPNPRYLYPSAVHREALASLICGIENGAGFTALISEPGMGKTTLLFDLLNTYREVVPIAFVFQTQCNSRELLFQIAEEFQIAIEDDNLVKLHSELKLYLVRHASSRPVVLVIDEAQNLEHSALETVRLLSDFETPDHKLLHIILSGQPRLADMLKRPELVQLQQRITILARLSPLPPEETARYIEHRLRCAGYAGPALFSAAALSRINTHSHGIPRLINSICFNALLIGSSAGLRELGEDVVQEAATDLDLSSAGTERPWYPAARGCRPQAAVSVPGEQRTAVGEVRTQMAPPLVAVQAARSAPSMAPQPRAASPSAIEIADQAQKQAPTPERKMAGAPAEVGKSMSGSSHRRRPQVGTSGRAARPHLRGNLLVVIASLLVIYGIASLLLWQPNVGARPSPAAPPARVAATLPPVAVAASTDAAADGESRASDEHSGSDSQRALSSAAKAQSKPATRSRRSKREHIAAAKTPIKTPRLAVEDKNDDAKTGPEEKPDVSLGAENLAIGEQDPPPPPDTTLVAHPSQAITAGITAMVSGIAAQPPLASPPRQAEAVVTGGGVLEAPKPVYPPEAVAAGIEGDVQVAMDVGVNGEVTDVHIVSGESHLARAARNAVRHWRYHPYYLNGQPIPMQANAIVRFRLSSLGRSGREAIAAQE